MREKMFSILMICFFILTGFQSSTVQDAVINGFKNNDSKSIVKHFNTSVSLSLNGEERISTKFQSEQLLNEFFKENKVSAIKAVSSGSNNTVNNYLLFTIKVGKEDLEVMVKLLEIKGEPTVVEFKIY